MIETNYDTVTEKEVKKIIEEYYVVESGSIKQISADPVKIELDLVMSDKLFYGVIVNTRDLMAKLDQFVNQHSCEVKL